MSGIQVNKNLNSVYEFVLRTAAEGVLLVGEDGLCAMLNPAAAAMLQIASEDVLGQTPKTVFRQNPSLVRLLRSQGLTKQDVILPMERIAQGICQDLPDGSKVVILNDITEQRELESRREALVKAISHDLRNPLSALNGYADLVSKFGDLNDKQARFITRIEQTCTKLWEVTESLVNLAWIEAGMPLQYVPFELAGLIRQVAGDLAIEAQQKNIKIVISIQDTVPEIMGDPTRIKQAIVHIVENSIRYSDSMMNVGIHAWQQHQKVFCSVTDRGFGIANEELDQIWDRMWRSTDERVRNIPGGGVGLTYTKTVIERHGGNIWVDSRFDEGSTFTFVLPLVQER
jgi:two-component system sensor histidine kinase VicK